MIHVLCETCQCESFTGGQTGERMAHEFEAAHAGQGHTTTRKAVRTPRTRGVPDVDHRDSKKGVNRVDVKDGVL